MTFYRYGSVDPRVFAQNSQLNHYGDFLEKMGIELKLTNYERQVPSLFN